MSVVFPGFCRREYDNATVWEGGKEESVHVLETRYVINSFASTGHRLTSQSL